MLVALQLSPDEALVVVIVIIVFSLSFSFGSCSTDETMSTGLGPTTRSSSLSIRRRDEVSVGLLRSKQRCVVGGLLVEAGEYGPRSGRDVCRFIVVAGEGANVIKRVEDHHCCELDLMVKIASKEIGAVVAVELAGRDSR
jgi:hypothetical protein